MMKADVGCSSMQTTEILSVLTQRGKEMIAVEADEMTGCQEIRNTSLKEIPQTESDGCMPGCPTLERPQVASLLIGKKTICFSSYRFEDMLVGIPLCTYTDRTIPDSLHTLMFNILFASTMLNHQLNRQEPMQA